MLHNPLVLWVRGVQAYLQRRIRHIQVVLFRDPCVSIRDVRPSIFESALLRWCGMDICVIFRKHCYVSTIGCFPQERRGDWNLHIPLRSFVIYLENHVVCVLDIQLQRAERYHVLIFISSWIYWVFRADRSDYSDSTHGRLPLFLHLLNEKRNTIDIAIIRCLRVLKYATKEQINLSCYFHRFLLFCLYFVFVPQQQSENFYTMIYPWFSPFLSYVCINTTLERTT